METIKVKKKTVYIVDEIEFNDPKDAIEHEAAKYCEALKGAGFSAPGAARKANAIEEYLTFKETGILPEAKAKKAAGEGKDDE
jgi:hypothetical protein